ncbi:MAG TPA: TRAP transporter substrate-binding protein [Burkholderiaceae bacterium]|jgi:tripartite ATP-independent transporter DctP family solute receptor
MNIIDIKKAIALVIVWACMIGMGQTVFAQVNVREIRVGIGLSDTHPQGLAVTKFAELVAKRSEGKIRVRLHANGTLGNDQSMIEDLKTGKLEMCVPDTATLVPQVSGFGILNIPFLFTTETDADALLDSPFGDKLQAKLQEKGLVGLGFWENGFRSVTNNARPILQLEDMHGLRMRVIKNPLYIDMFNALGSTPVPMPFPEVYNALHDNKIDGQENPLATIQNSKFYSVQKYLTLTRHAYSAWVLLMSKKLWDELSPQEKAIIKESALEARDFERKTIRANNGFLLELLKKEGMTINEVSTLEHSKLRMAARPITKKYQKEFGKDWSDAMYLGLTANEMKKFNQATGPAVSTTATANKEARQ